MPEEKVSRTMPESTLVARESDEKAGGARLYLYVAGFVAVQLAVLAVVLLLTATPWFLTHDAYAGYYQTGYGMRLQHADCEVLIYGDSSSLTGLDPRVIESATGMKSCNIAEGTSVQGVVGSRFPLDSYLKANKRPRYLLLLYTPSKFRPYLEPFTDYQPEGVLYAAQFERSREMFLGLLHRGRWVVDYDLWAGRLMIKALLRWVMPDSGTTVIDTRAQRASRNGNWPYPLPAETRCVRTERHIDPKSIGRYAQDVAKMREPYGIDGTTVVMDIAPAAECDTLQDVYRAQAEGLHDNAFEVRPISDFNEGDIHFSPEGSAHISTEAAQQIVALELLRRKTEGPR
jgi:hypothetical protein